jgi:hypothetical protein
VNFIPFSFKYFKCSLFEKKNQKKDELDFVNLNFIKFSETLGLTPFVFE